MNWKHLTPKNEASEHKTGWLEDATSDCPCNPTVDIETHTVRHKPLK